MKRTTSTKVLGLDISSTNIGWCLLRDQAAQQAGTITLKGDLDARLRAGSLRLYQLLSLVGRLDAIAFEDAAYRGHPQAIIAQARMVGALYAMVTALNMKLPIIGVAPASAKKLLTGSGRADKNAMISEARRYGPIIAWDEHQADAFAVGLSAMYSLVFAEARHG